MRLTNMEKSFVNSWLRTLMLRKLEAPKVLSNLVIGKKSVCLDIGCGRGVSLLLINQYLNCDKVIGIDLDPDMIEYAIEFLSRPPRWAKNIRTDNIELLNENATNLNFPDQNFNAVFLFGVLHHILDWKKVISEIYRILKLGGILSFVEEILMPKYFSNIHSSKESNYFKYNIIYKENLIKFLKQLGFSIIGIKRLLTSCFIRVKK